MIHIKRLFSEKCFTFGLIGFVFLQIFIDMYRVFFESRYQLFGIALPELINFVYFGALTLIFLVRSWKRPKHLFPFLIYTFALVIYLAFHIHNILKLDQEVLVGSEPNWFKEIYFIARTYLVPVYIFYYFLCSKLNLLYFKKAISILSLVISTNIIITNFFKVSFICYASTLETNSFITKNFFEWFYNPDLANPSYMASKGWFYMGNQIGLILLMLMPFVLMIAFESGRIGHYLIAFSNAVAMIFVGTKVSTIGCILILTIGLIFAVVFGMILKQFSFKAKHLLFFAVIALVSFAILPFSPMASLQGERIEAQSESEEQQNVKKDLLEDLEEIKSNKKNEKLNEKELAKFKKDFTAYIKSAPYFFGIDPQFLELFPIERNFDFWYQIVIHGNNRQSDYRYFKSILYDEVLKINDNEMGDTLFGIGYVSNFPYSEQDFLSQSIWFGAVGTILLLGPYCLGILYAIFLALKKYKTCFTYQNGFFALSICATTLLSIMAGHLFYGIFSISIFALISACFVKHQTERYRAQ